MKKLLSSSVFLSYCSRYNLIKQLNISITLPTLIVLTCLLGACKESSLFPSSDGEEPSPISLTEVQGSSWKLVSFIEVSDIDIRMVESANNWTATPVPSGQEYTITFYEDSFISNIDCYTVDGEYRLGANNSLTLIVIPFIFDNCGTESLAIQYSPAIESAVSYRATTKDLYIYYDDASKILHFTRVIDDVKLQVSPTFLPPDSDPYELTDFSITDDIIRFDVGYSGCQQNAREFVLFGPEEINPTFPITKATLYLIHNDLDDALCTIYFQEIREFDLALLKKNYQQQSGQQSGSIELTIIGPSSIVPTDNTIVYNF